jgi:Glycine-zipper domain
MKDLARCVLALVVAAAASACATLPAGPSVMVLPGNAKSFDEFADDDALCRGWAENQVGTTTKQASTESGVTTAAIATGVGAVAGTAIGAAAGNVGAGAAIGAGSGLLFGSAAGADQAAWASGTVQQRYDGAYMQCMYAKGNKIPVAVDTAQRLGTPAPSAPPRPGPPPTASRRLPPPPPPGRPPPPPPDAG